MSRVAPGTYIIYNRVQNEHGQRLALTYNGDKEPITVTLLDPKDTKQHWEVKDYHSGSLQHVKPVDNLSLEAGWGKGVIETVHAGGQIWGITSQRGWAIQDGQSSVFWSVDTATNKASVTPISDSIGPQQRWIFVPVDHPLPQ